MRKKYSIYIGGFIAFILTGCSLQENTISPDGQSVPLEISTYIKPGSRALNKSTFGTGDVLSLWACQTTGAYDNNFISNFMENIAVTREESSVWTYSPLASWPSDENEHVSFVTFYPWNEVQASALSYPYTVNSDLSKQEDVLWGSIVDACISDRNGTRVNGNESDAAFETASGSLNLKYQHALSKIVFKAKLASAYSEIAVTLKELSVNHVYGGGTFVLKNDLSNGEWTNLNTFSNYTLLTGGKSVLSTEELDLGNLLLIPQPFVNSYLHIEYSHTLADGGTKEISKDILITTVWEANKTYNYTFNLSLDVDKIQIDTEIGEWSGTVDPVIDPVPAEAVDLGLSVKWASYNMGATKPEEYGGLYGWGDPTGTKTSTNYSDYPSITDICATEYDIAYNLWGNKWRLPTYIEMQELINQCTWVWTTVNGIDGYKVEATNKKSIFLPAAGSRYDGNISEEGSYGYYWSGSNSNYSYSSTLDFYSSYMHLTTSLTRPYGCSVRPVQE